MALDDPASVAFAEREGYLEIPWPAARIHQDYFQWLVALDVFAEQSLSESETRALQTFEQMVTGQASSAHLVPRLPTIIPQLMRSLKDEKMTGAQLARQISKDPALVGEVIRLANSPYYHRRNQKIASIEQAVILVGQDGLRQLIARVAFYPILNPNSGPMTRLAGARLWSQSEKCAVVCRCLADEHQSDAFSAYLAGLVSNVGMLVGWRFMDQVLPSEACGIPNSWEFYRIFGAHAAYLSHRIVDEWRFPEAVIVALGEKAAGKVKDSMSQLGKLLSLSDLYSKLHALSEHHRLPAEVAPQTLDNEHCYRLLSDV